MVFDKQYYYFVSGLPDIFFDSSKLPFTVEEFRAMLEDVLSPKDKKLIDKYFLKHDNHNLMVYLKDKNAKLKEEGRISAEEIKETIDSVAVDFPVQDAKIPSYFEDYIRLWLDENAHTENKLWEDLMTSFYMDYGMESKNSLVSRWFELNLNIGNILAAIYSRKYGRDVNSSIVGNNEVAQFIRENPNARDFGLSRELDYFDNLLRLSEENDIYERERKIDKLRWDWLEENTVFDYFNIEYIFAYLCKLQILERWVSLNAEEGERVFRALINNLKGEVPMPEE
ncbi:MAG: DUF2764 family protein [Petrimonas sp.]|nr:DUF2764 family protein [Petrimonas sp.]